MSTLLEVGKRYKIVYADSDIIKVMFGTIASEDDNFVVAYHDDGVKRILAKSIIKSMTVREDRPPLDLQDVEDGG